MTRHRKTRALPWVTFAAVISILAGMLLMAAVVAISSTSDAIVTNALRDAVKSTKVEVKPSVNEKPLPVSPPAPEIAAAEPPSTAISADVTADLRSRALTLPVQGIDRAELRDTFSELRGGSRRHEAIDVLAPRDSPVLAVEDGEIARLLLSAAGGITIYQTDPTKTYVYYYAHLERYAEGLRDGDQVARGQIIGYVGTSGNAPRDTPHLHFAIFKMTDEKRWWQGTPIDPYSVLR
jgi:murein DD-endopeptidase MepM/ murein hydrolase activator NlpD